MTAKTNELEEKMRKAIEFNYNFYKENGRFPKTSEDPYYRSARRYFNGAENYRKQVFLQNGYTEEEAEYELNKKSISKEDLFNQALTQFKEKGLLWSSSELVDEYFGGLYYLRMQVLEECGYSKEEAIYEIKDQIMKSALSLEEVIQPLVDYINEVGEIPRSYEFEERGSIVRRFGKWETAIMVAVDLVKNGNKESVKKLYDKYKDMYLPNIETLEPIIDFIKENSKLPKAADINSYHKVQREYILWDNALDEAMSELGYPIEKRMEYFRAR